MIKLQTVGIKDIQYPISVREKGGGLQETVASITLHARMPSEHRGSSVSTFLAALDKYQEEMSVRILPRLVAEVQEGLQAESARVEMTFPYFIEKRAPVSRTASLMEYTCRFSCGAGPDEEFIISVWVPVTTLCPCSKEISEVGAHNQRGEVNLNIAFRRFIWVEDLIEIIESGVSCEVFALLKRPDEKHVTEAAYNNPMFVEDVVRRVAELVRARPEITWYSVGVESFESIHKHSAYAYLDSCDQTPA